jgi:hypothetical protein
MATPPTISVVMAVYNGEAYLGEAIESILQQRFPDFELLIINDGSTDNSAALLEAYRRRDPRITLWHQENQGLTRSLRRGVEHARGRYIARMDADDVSMPTRFARQVALLDSDPRLGLCGTWIAFAGERVGEVWRYPTDDAAIRCHMLFNSPIAHPAAMMRREAFSSGRVAYDADYTYAQDYALWVRFAEHYRLANIPDVLLHYRIHPAQIASTHNRPIRTTGIQQVQRALLAHLSIAPTPAESALHHRIGQWDYPTTRTGLQQVEAWLWRLQHANAHHARYAEPHFGALLADHWFRACYAATQHGLWTWKLFWMSPTGRRAELSGKQRLSFALNCVLRRKST